ncbi:MAG: glycosyltransferase family 39 protein [Acidobacteria bacterium]|nr:glycosyltransferase family 39 protein [Acidobacteriota bacterium]
MRRPVLTLACIACFSFILGLGRPAITDSDEGFYAEAAREMVESGDWLTPRFNYEDRWEKPVLYYWLTAATYVVTSPTEAAARWWSALSGLGLVLLTWAMARRMMKQDDAAWLAGAIVATCYGYFAMARLALPDLPLTFLVTLTIWGGIERRWLLVGAAAGLGFLMKGPIALVVPALVLAPIWWRERATAPIRIGDLAIAALVGAAIGLPWYVAMTVKHGAPYLQSFFVGDNLERFATSRFNDPRAPWFYVPIVVGGLFPWSMYLLILPWPSIIAIARGRRLVTQIEWRLLAWILLPLVFFTISIGKQPRYILPVLPPIAILLAQSIMDRVRTANRNSATALTAATWATAATYVILMLLLYRSRMLFIGTYPTLMFAGMAVLGLAGIAMAWITATRHWQLLPGAATFCAAMLLLTVQFGALSGVRPEPVEQMAALISAHRLEEPIGTYQVFVRNLGFYTGVAQRDLFTESLALDFLESSAPVLLVVRATDLPALEAASGVRARRIGEVRYLNTANIRLGTILAPDPDAEIETVLLVSNR